MSFTYNLFISHSWTYGDVYDKLVSMLDSRSYFPYRNYSVPKNDPIHNAPNQQLLYDAIKRQITLCHVIIIPAGIYSSYSKWIDKEIAISKRDFKKPILAIEPWGSQRASRIVTDAADLVVGWNTESIISGIRKISI